MTRTPLYPENIPEPLRGARRWVSVVVTPEPDGKLTKRPVTPRGDPAKSNDPSTWSSLPEVLAAIEHSVGHYPAVVIGPDYPLMLVDLDGCIGEDGGLSDLAAAAAAAAGDTYIECSASGRGLHILVWNDRPYPANPTPGLELYWGSPRLVMMTGALYGVVGGSAAPTVNQITPVLATFLRGLTGALQGDRGDCGGPGDPTGERVRPTKKQAAARTREFKKRHPTVPAGERNNTLFKYAALLQNLGYSPVDIAEELWAFNNTACQPPFRRENATEAAEVDGILRSAVANVPVGILVPAPTASGQPHEPGPAPTTVDPEIVAKALEIYQSRRFVEYCREVWRQIWCGDEYVLDLVLLAAACLSVTNASDGINIHIAGSTQSGKSAAAKTALRFVHPKNKFTGTFSRLGLFSGLFHEKMLIFSDDTRFDEEQAGVLRGALTNWRTGSSRITVVDKKWAEVSIPPRINLVLTSVDSVTTVTRDGQDESRFLTVETRRDPEALATIQRAMQHEPPDVTRDLQVVHAVWELIVDTRVAFHRELPPDTTVPLREWARYLDLIRARALLFGRTTTTDEDVTNTDYLVELSRRMVAADIAGLTQSERVVQRVLRDRAAKNLSPMSVGEIQLEIQRPLSSVYRALRGIEGTFDRPLGGLLVKDRYVQMLQDRDTHDRLFCYHSTTTHL
jgi:hypothetical protein